jgi:hypothetical protein
LVGGGPVTGSLTETQDNQIATATGFLGVIPIPAGHPLDAYSDSYDATTGPDAGLVVVDVHSVAASPVSYAVEAR